MCEREKAGGRERERENKKRMHLSQMSKCICDFPHISQFLAIYLFQLVFMDETALVSLTKMGLLNFMPHNSVVVGVFLNCSSEPAGGRAGCVVSVIHSLPSSSLLASWNIHLGLHLLLTHWLCVLNIHKTAKSHALLAVAAWKVSMKFWQRNLGGKAWASAPGFHLLSILESEI